GSSATPTPAATTARKATADAVKLATIAVRSPRRIQRHVATAPASGSKPRPAHFSIPGYVRLPRNRAGTTPPHIGSAITVPTPRSARQIGATCIVHAGG